MGSAVDAIKKKIKDQGGNVSGIHTVAQGIKRLDLLFEEGPISIVNVRYEAQTESLDFTTKEQ